MSTRQTKGKQTKGKQKIVMKEVETYGDRMITFSKRKSGIHKKMTEMVTMCDVDVAFLVFSQAGKPYTFSHPSMEEVADRLKNPSRQEPAVKRDDNTAPLVEAYKKLKIENLRTKQTKLAKDLEMEKERMKTLKESINENEVKKMWWNLPTEGMSEEDLKQRHRAFVDLYHSLCDIASMGIDCDGSSSGSAGRGYWGGGEA